MAKFRENDRVKFARNSPDNDAYPEFAGALGTINYVSVGHPPFRVTWDEKLRDGTNFSWCEEEDIFPACYGDNFIKVRNMSEAELAKFLARPCPHDSDKCIELGHETCEACFLDWLSK